MSKLKPCPFCGGEAKVTGGKECPDLPDKKPYSITCECGCSFLYVADYEEEAIDIWNRRAESEPYELDGFDITNADGTPVDYGALGMKYKDEICYCDVDGFYLGEDGSLILVDDCGSGVWVKRKDYKIIPRYKSVVVDDKEKEQC